MTIIAVEIETIEKLRMYKTAYSHLYASYVSIRKVYKDTNGEPLFSCIVGDKKHLFRREELTQFCL